MTEDQYKQRITIEHPPLASFRGFDEEPFVGRVTAWSYNDTYPTDIDRGGVQQLSHERRLLGGQTVVTLGTRAHEVLAWGLSHRNPARTLWYFAVIMEDGELRPVPRYVAREQFQQLWVSDEK